MTNGTIDPSGPGHPLESLTNEQVLQLATSLRLSGDIDPSQTGDFPQTWLTSQKHAAKGLHLILLESSTDKLTRYLAKVRIPTPNTILCWAHKYLDPHLIGSCFENLQQEWDIHVGDAQRYLYCLTGKLNRPEYAEVMAYFINTIIGISSLIMTRGDFDNRWGYACNPCNHGAGHDHGRFPEEEVVRFRYVEGGCGGCVLAAFGGAGGNGSGLAVLWGAMVSRARNGGREPALFRLVEAWIGLKGEEARVIREVGEQWFGFLDEVKGWFREVTRKGGVDIPPFEENRTSGIRGEVANIFAVKDSNRPGLRTQQGNYDLRGLYLAVQELRGRLSVP